MTQRFTISARTPAQKRLKQTLDRIRRERALAQFADLGEAGTGERLLRPPQLESRGPGQVPQVVDPNDPYGIQRRAREAEARGTTLFQERRPITGLEAIGNVSRAWFQEAVEPAAGALAFPFSPSVREAFSEARGQGQELTTALGTAKREGLKDTPWGAVGALEVIADPLNLLPGVGFGGAIARGGGAVARGAVRGAESALVRVPQRQVQEAGLRLAGGAPVAGGAQWEVEVAGEVLLPGRTRPDKMSRLFQVNARTRPQAIKAVKDAGHTGEIVSVRRADIATEQLGQPLTTPVASAAQEPWQMTRAEWRQAAINYMSPNVRKSGAEGLSAQTEIEKLRKGDPETLAWWNRRHDEVIQTALSEGKPVPASVLADYPDLAAQVAKPVASVTKRVPRPRRPIVPSRQAEVAEGVKPYVHLTTPESATAIRAGGFRGSTSGNLGPGVYLTTNEPGALIHPRFKGAIAIEIETPTDARFLQITGNKANTPHEVFQALYGKEGTRLYDEANSADKIFIGRGPAQPGDFDGVHWDYVQKLVKDAGYQGIEETHAVGRQRVVFDASGVRVAGGVPTTRGNVPPAVPEAATPPAAERAVGSTVPSVEPAPVTAPPPATGELAAGGMTPPPAAAPPAGRPPRRTRTATGAPPPEQPFAANIRLSKYPEDIRGPIADWAAENAAVVQEARRGVRNDARVLSDARVLVEEMGGDFARIQRRWKPGEAWNAEEVTAIRGVLRQRTQAVLDAAKASRDSNSDENLANLMIALKEQSRVQEIVHGVTAEAGRALRAFRQAASEMAAGGEVARFEELLKRLGGRENLTKWADLISTLDLNDPVAVNNFIRMTQQPRFFDYLTEYFVNSILSGPATHLRNMLGNTGATLTQLPERGLAAGVERVLAPAQGRAIERFWDEVPAAAIGAIHGLDEGTRGMFQVLKTGQRMQEATKIELLEFRTRAFTGPLGRAINAPTNAMEAADALFYSVNMRASLQANIVRRARKEGLSGQRLIERIADLKSAPTQDLLERAVKEAETRLFRNDPGPFVSEIMRLRTKYPPLRFIVPFVRTPANLIIFGLARSPAGFLNPGMYRNLAAKNPEAADQIARALMGSMVAGAIAWQFTQGNITAQTPSSAAERDRFYREGKQPWSIRIGGHWVSYRDFEPFSITFGLVGSAMTAMENTGEESADATELVGQAVTGMGRFLLDRSFFTGLSDTLNAVQEPERYGSQWLQRMAGAAVPFSALLRQIAQTADPTFRKPEGVVESLEANIPGLTGRVPEKVTAFGETSERPSPALFPVRVSKSKQSAVDAELDRLDIEVGFVGKTIGGQKLTRSRQLEYQTIAGQETLTGLVEMLQTPEYQEATDEDKQTQIEAEINDARARARGQMEDVLAESASEVTPTPVEPTKRKFQLKRVAPTPEPAGVR